MRWGHATAIYTKYNIEYMQYMFAPQVPSCKDPTCLNINWKPWLCIMFQIAIGIFPHKNSRLCAVRVKKILLHFIWIFCILDSHPHSLNYRSVRSPFTIQVISLMCYKIHNRLIFIFKTIKMLHCIELNCLCIFV